MKDMQEQKLTKQCTRCTFVLTLDAFTPTKRRYKLGYLSVCKSCLAKEVREKRFKKRPVKDIILDENGRPPIEERCCDKHAIPMVSRWEINPKYTRYGGCWKYTCPKCARIRSIDWRKNNPDKMKSKTIRGSHSRREKELGVTEKEYNAMVALQDGKCKICGCIDTRSLSTDHDHETGKVRGLLCKTCNLALGNAKDSPELLRKMADYLEFHGNL